MSDQSVMALDVGGSSVKRARVEVGTRIVGSISVDAIQSRATADKILNTLATIIAGHLEKVKVVRGSKRE